MLDVALQARDGVLVARDVVERRRSVFLDPDLLSAGGLAHSGVKESTVHKARETECASLTPDTRIGWLTFIP
ncbi:hypothetical protein GCM10009039_01170 [Halocalculus aciditolerans]|uniref:Uncharacterized protein n=1 Tax=Halocalculus aciditolerans TaxID=1383812 RepID=A0A830FEC8_9EURY|nr:hypothetical protein GCM10009039_01170 [Halocalculus aciditolerans]